MNHIKEPTKDKECECQICQNNGGGCVLGFDCKACCNTNEIKNNPKAIACTLKDKNGEEK